MVVFWIGAAVAIFLISLIWALFSMRATYLTDQTRFKQPDEPPLAVPPQPAAKPISPQPSQPSSPQPVPSAMLAPLAEVGKKIPQTIEEARAQLQAAIEKAQQKPSQSEAMPAVSPTLPKQVLPNTDVKPTAASRVQTVQQAQSPNMQTLQGTLGRYLGEVAINGRRQK